MKQTSLAPRAFNFHQAHFPIIFKSSILKVFCTFLPLFLLVPFSGCQKSDIKANALKEDINMKASRQNEKSRCVPFKASFTTMDEITQEATDANPIQKDKLTGTGIGTLIGKASEETNAEGDITLPFPALITSTTTIIAANGDKIYSTNDGYLQEPSSNGDLLLTGHCTVTGGTGRFTNATGSFEFVATGNIFQPKGAVTFDGTICY